MLTEEEIKEIRKQLRRGIPEGEIRNDLKEKGLSDDDIAKIFAPKKYDMRPWYQFFAAVFLVLGVYFFVAKRSLLFFVFAALMFLSYYYENRRLKSK